MSNPDREYENVVRIAIADVRRIILNAAKRLPREDEFGDDPLLTMCEDLSQEIVELAHDAEDRLEIDHKDDEDD